MSEVEEGGGSEGVADEERAEAEKFNRMVDEGKLTPAEVAQVEKDKTPEEIGAEKAAMEKVMDINQEGTAYTAISCKYVKNILSEGLLGSPLFVDSKVLFDPRIQGESMKKHWAETARRIGRNVVFCNIVGRDINSIEEAGWGFPGVIFDLSKFTEKEPVFNYDAYRGRFDQKLKFGHRTYRAYSDSPSQRGYLSSIDEEGRYNPHLSDGFAVSPRVAPNFFRGFIVKGEKNLDEVLHIAKETYKEKPKLSVPVYGRNGDLLWPRQMTYEQVKKFVAEREADKRAEEGERQEE